MTAGVPQIPLTRSDVIFFPHLPLSCTVLFAPVAEQATIIIQRPGRYVASVQSSDGDEQDIGEFCCVLVDPPPLTPERVAAIKSDPNAVRAVRAEFGCRFCPSKCRVYAALERNGVPGTDSYTWYEDIPDHFTCECGKTQFDLSTVKRNFFAFVGQPRPLSGELSCLRLYETHALESLTVEFVDLLNTDPPEESIQKFIEKNPILLHQFPAERILFKPPILTQYKADFAIVTPQEELVLIEIERSSTRLLKIDGGQHADLTHAFDQIRNWLHELSEHRLAALHSLNIPSEMISKVRGVVIAGRDSGNDASYLRRLKGTDHGAITLLTYDDIAESLGALARRMGDL
jgi:Domain of unknown function (DUF4263)